jgi:hypothetical protein
MLDNLIVVGMLSISLALLIGAVVWSVAAAILAYRTEQRLDAEGATAEAHVVDRHVRNRHDMIEYCVTYQFTARAANGTSVDVRRVASVSLTQYDRLTEGTRVCVDYLPSNPQVTRFTKCNTSLALKLVS